MNKIELDRLEWLYGQLHRYKEAAIRLERENSELKAQIAKQALNEQFGYKEAKQNLGSVYGSSCKKEGEES